MSIRAQMEFRRAATPRLPQPLPSDPLSSVLLRSLFACSDSTEVSAQVRAIDCRTFPRNTPIGICEALEGLHDAEPCSVSFPAGETVVAGSPGAVVCGNVSPGAPSLMRQRMPLMTRR